MLLEVLEVVLEVLEVVLGAEGPYKVLIRSYNVGKDLTGSLVRSEPTLLMLLNWSLQGPYKDTLRTSMRAS